MGLIAPDAPHYDLAEYRRLPYPDRVRLACLDWVHVGFGAPAGTYLFYVLKVGLYVGGWVAAVRIGGVDGGIAEWWDTPVAFVKAVVWTLLFEALGLGCGTGPLTGRYFPPFAAPAHMLRPGTIRLPPFPRRVPLTAGSTRGWVDVLLYAGVIAATVRVLVASEVTVAALVPIMVLLPLLALRDKVAFLMARGEHYLVTVGVLLFLADPVGADTAWADVAIGVIAGAKAVQLAIWWWAATSKLNHHFPYVVGVMVSNHPFNRSLALRRRLFPGFPHDLTPGRIPAGLAHGGTVIEYLVPLALVLSDGGTLTTVALAVMVAFHLWIFSSFALGVPQEWNVFFIYSALVLFGQTNAAVKPWQLEDPLLWLGLLVMLVVVPVVGNLRPEKVSFLPSMRYYAGNWGTTTWLFTPAALDRFDREVPKAAGEVLDQLRRFFDDDTNEVSIARVAAFRAMHLHGRLVQRLILRAVEDPDDHVLREGELVAGMALGWNFGDMHLHHEQLLAAVQERCGFAPGEVRVVVVESQPAHRPRWAWRIVDAADGVLLSGTAEVAEAMGQQPWPDPAPHLRSRPAQAPRPSPGRDLPARHTAEEAR